MLLEALLIRHTSSVRSLSPGTSGSGWPPLTPIERQCTNVTRVAHITPVVGVRTSYTRSPILGDMAALMSVSQTELQRAPNRAAVDVPDQLGSASLVRLLT